MVWRYNLLPDEFGSMTIQVLCDVRPRNAEKMIDRWLNDGYIKRIAYGRYHKVLLELP